MLSDASDQEEGGGSLLREPQLPTRPRGRCSLAVRGVVWRTALGPGLNQALMAWVDGAAGRNGAHPRSGCAGRDAHVFLAN